ncbi:MAG TPA: NAD(P)/FAD-dependent oxidoreductase [Polyangiales bacterium]|nr:NAD(P)/FAD-dependent oxidoreductase [Polyangiales bacterium]
MNIRRFRVGSISVLVSLVWACAVLSLPQRAFALPSPPPRVIVVGAGMAGLAAATRLKAAGFEVKILEARDRVGGRMFTSTNAQGTTIDLGASWIHGDQAEFETLVAGMNLTTRNTDFKAMRFHNMANQAMDVTASMWNDLKFRLADAMSWNATFFPDRTIQSVLDIMWTTGNFPGYTREFVDNFTTAAFDTEFAATASKTPVKMFWELIPNLDDDQAWDAFLGSSESDNTAFPLGFNQVSDRLKAGLDIRLNSEVTRIDYPANQSLVTVTIKGGTQFTANHVIVTVPIGVLKAGTITFAPALPSQKTGAIQRLGSGLLNKIYLEFGTQFWQSGPTAPDVLGMSSPTRGAFSIWIDMKEITGKPVLMTYTSGDAARTIEGFDDTKTKNEAMLRLRDTFPGTVPDPVSVTVTRWNQDPFARGSYSTFQQATLLGDRALLRAPVANNKVLFAGEATLDTGFAQVPGAYRSGLREADRLRQAYP